MFACIHPEDWEASSSQTSLVPSLGTLFSHRQMAMADPSVRNSRSYPPNHPCDTACLTLPFHRWDSERCRARARQHSTRRISQAHLGVLGWGSLQGSVGTAPPENMSLVRSQSHSLSPPTGCPCSPSQSFSFSTSLLFSGNPDSRAVAQGRRDGQDRSSSAGSPGPILLLSSYVKRRCYLGGNKVTSYFST